MRLQEAIEYKKAAISVGCDIYSQHIDDMKFSFY